MHKHIYTLHLYIDARRLQARIPKYNRPWYDSLNWYYANGILPKMARHSEDRVVNSILWAWCHMGQHLVRHNPETLTEWTQHPLFWNPQVRATNEINLALTELHFIGDWTL